MNPANRHSQQIEDQALTWANRLDGGELPPEDRVALDAWLARDSAHEWRLAHYRQFYAQLHGTLPAMAAAGMIAAEESVAPVLARRRWLGWGAAAAVAFTAGTIFWLMRPQTIATVAAQRATVTLADGSRVELNARTRLAVTMRRDSRRVRLERGEAAFTVTHDPARPFFVETAAGTVRVTGTVFDVRAAPSGKLEVTVVEGRVAVRPVDADGHEFPAPRALAAGDQLVFDPATAVVDVTRPAAIDDAVAWREGRVVFAGAPLREALERFAAYHQRNLSAAPEVADLPLGGRYTLDDLDQFLRSLEQALPVKVWRQGDGSVRIVGAPRAP